MVKERMIDLKHKIQNGVPVQNNRRVATWMVEDQQRCYENNRGSLLSNICARLKSMYGEHGNVFVTLDGHTFKVWTIRFDGNKYNVYSGRGGSYYEILNVERDAVKNMKDGDVERVIKFLTHISNGK